MKSQDIYFEDVKQRIQELTKNNDVSEVTYLDYDFVMTLFSQRYGAYESAEYVLMRSGYTAIWAKQE